MSTEPIAAAPWSSRSPTRSLIEALVIVTGVVALTNGGDAFGRDMSKKLENPLPSVLLAAAVMLGLVALMLRTDAQWRTSLAFTRISPLRLLAFSGVGLIGAYVAGGIASGLVILISGANAQTLLAQKRELLDKVSHIALWQIPLIALGAGIWEEIAFRGFVLGRLRTALGSITPNSRQRDITALLLSSAVFGACHLYQGSGGVAQTFGVGCALAVLTLVSKSLWPAIIVHTTVDTVGLFAAKVLGPVLEKLHTLK